MNFLPVNEAGFTITAEALNRAFADYFVKLDWSEALLGRMAVTDSLAFDRSFLIRRDGGTVGVTLVAHRGNRIRVAAMGFVPSARRQGLGKAALDHLFACEQKRGIDRVLLEVIESNSAAVQLYLQTGFIVRDRLVGAQGRPSTDIRSLPSPTPASREHFLDLLRAQAGPELPWQISVETLASLDSTFTAYTHGTAGALVLIPASETGHAVLRGLTTAPTPLGTEELAELLQSLALTRPGCEWKASPVFPSSFAPVFASAGLRPSPFAQLQMEKVIG